MHQKKSFPTRVYTSPHLLPSSVRSLLSVCITKSHIKKEKTNGGEQEQEKEMVVQK